LRNKDNEAFMVNYAPKMKDLAPRDLVARAIESEIREGRGTMNPDYQIEHVWIDLRHLPDSIHDEQIPEVTSFFKRYVNLDPKKELCPVRPSNHYHMGGIPTNEFGEVQNISLEVIPGLFAVGECASASFHGFNRLGTNSILELITMGKFVGDRVLEYLEKERSEAPQGKSMQTIFRFSSYLEAKQGDNIENIRDTMRSMMTEKVGVFRTGQGIAETLEALKELKQRADNISLMCGDLKMNQELVQRWELDNLLAVAMVIAQAALARQESRGAHYRDDFPERKDEFNYHTLASMKRFGEVELGRRKVDMSVFEAGGKDCGQFNMMERKY